MLSDNQQDEDGELQSQGSIEDGEIVDDSEKSERVEEKKRKEIQIPQVETNIEENHEDSFIPLVSDRTFNNNLVYDYRSDEDIGDEAPEEILNRYAREKALHAQPEEFLDPTLCRICKSNPHRYRCPRCDLRSCSLKCSRRHKEQNVCDGIRQPFQPVASVVQFDGQISVKDQMWMSNVQNKVYEQSNSHEQFLRQSAGPRHQYPLPIENIPRHLPPPNFIPSNDGVAPDNEQNDEASGVPREVGLNDRGFPQYINEDGTRNSANSATERFLLPGALRRRILLSYSNDKGEDNSRHEQFSDTIFWCIDLIFRKQLPDGTYDDYNYRIQNIPETIRICTILKQFLKPRQYGCIVSESDLDMSKMQTFIDAGNENLVLLMKVPRYYKERYYLVNAEKSMLDNLRNRVVVDHPKIIVILNSECFNMTTLAEDEAEELRHNITKERNTQMGPRRGASSGYRGGNRGYNNAPVYNSGPPSGNFRGRGVSTVPFRSDPVVTIQPLIQPLIPYYHHHIPSNGNPRPRPYDRPPPNYGDRGGGRGAGGSWMRGRGGRGGGNRGGGGGGYGYNRQPPPRPMDAFDPFEPFQGKQTLPDDYGIRHVPAATENRVPAGGDTFNSLLTWENIKKPEIDVPPPQEPPSNNTPYEYTAPMPNNFGP